MILSSTAHVLFFRLFTPQIICLPLSSKCHSSRSGTSRSLKQNKQGESIEDKHNIYSCLHKPIQSLSRIANNSLTHSLTHSRHKALLKLSFLSITRTQTALLPPPAAGCCPSCNKHKVNADRKVRPKAHLLSCSTTLELALPLTLDASPPFHTRCFTLAASPSLSTSRNLTLVVLLVSLSLSHSRCLTLDVPSSLSHRHAREEWESGR